MTIVFNLTSCGTVAYMLGSTEEAGTGLSGDTVMGSNVPCSQRPLAFLKSGARAYSLRNFDLFGVYWWSCFAEKHFTSLNRHGLARASRGFSDYGKKAKATTQINMPVVMYVYWLIFHVITKLNRSIPDPCSTLVFCRVATEPVLHFKNSDLSLFYYIS